MSLGTLYTSSEAEGKRVQAVAAFAGQTIDVKAAGADIVKTPLLETTDGFSVFGDHAIGRYIASLAPNTTLLGSDAKQAALVDQWVSLADASLAANHAHISDLLSGALTPYNKPFHLTAADRFKQGLATVEKHLSAHTFLVGERISLADIATAATLQPAFGLHADAEVRAAFPAVVRHYETIVNQPALKPVFGETKYVEKAVQFTPPKKEKKEEVPKAPKVEKPKAEKKPKKEELDDEEDDKPIEEPKARNPLEDLPKSTFNLEDWKRAYSNKETRGADGALEWLYQHFDKEGFSLWRVDFKYNSELTQTFMSSNQIGGFFNRLEGSRKYLFGSVGVLGATNDSIITGALIGRGQDITKVVDVAPDYESYSYEKIDLENEEQKKFFEAALAWDLEIDGKKWVDGKAFK
ncbi:elongation factor 1-gamma [Auriscalpium vulgare]|uniref:Elongation factor 1-gamma n=1 Tax=Auriscalpium vulgare TaxID=40419 RepID=A0ACB8RHN2_9AGAM|nr:elongation factor 1-gamma [Auriscalpium vulgare]